MSMPKHIGVYQGGLMRCCLETLNAHKGAFNTAEEGSVLPCIWCSSSMKVVNVEGKGLNWVWNNPENLKHYEQAGK